MQLMDRKTGILKMLCFQDGTIVGGLRSLVYLLLLFFLTTPASLAEPASPFDDALISSINALNGRSSNDAALLKSIRTNNKQRRSYLKDRNAFSVDGRPLPQSLLSSNEWSGPVTGIVINYIDEEGNLLEPGTEFYIRDSGRRIRVFAMTDATKTLFYKGGNIRIKGFIYNDRILVEESYSTDETASPDNNLAAANSEAILPGDDNEPGCDGPATGTGYSD
jgi:hypothetical protein